MNNCRLVQIAGMFTLTKQGPKLNSTRLVLKFGITINNSNQLKCNILQMTIKPMHLFLTAIQLV